MDVKKVFESIERETAAEAKQSVKADRGKPRPSLVPAEAILAMAEVREYGTVKYGSSENWRLVEPERYIDALYRHLLAIVENGLDSTDAESRLPHIWHLTTDAAFLCAMYKEVMQEGTGLC